MKSETRNSDEIHLELMCASKVDIARRLELAEELSEALRREYPDERKRK